MFYVKICIPLGRQGPHGSFLVAAVMASYAEAAIMMRTEKAFTLAEMIMVALLLGIIAMVAVPRLQYAFLRKQKADITANQITSDLWLARRLAISDAAANISGYALNMMGGAPYKSYRIINLKTNGVVDSITIDPEVSCTGGASFKFGPLGNLLTGSDTQLAVSAEGKSYTVTVVSATGAVKCSQN